MLLVRRSHTPVVKNMNCECNRKILPVAKNHFLFQLSRGNNLNMLRCFEDNDANLDNIFYQEVQQQFHASQH